MSVDDDRGRAVQIYSTPWLKEIFWMRLAVSHLDRKRIVPPQPGLEIQEIPHDRL